MSFMHRPGLSKMWLLLAALAALLVVLVWLQPLDRLFRSPPHPAVGRELPPVTFEPLTGTDEPLRWGDLQGRVVLINFWGTWCPPCRRELPHIAALHRQFAERDDFVLVAVSCGPPLGEPEDLETLEVETREFLDSLGSDLPTYADPDLSARAAVDQVAGFSGYPTTLVLDRSGTIRGVWVGYREGMEEEIERLVANLLVAPRGAAVEGQRD